MAENELNARVRAVIARTFELEADALPAEPDADNIQKWDSLGHLALIEALEEEFGLELDHAAAVEMLSASAIVEKLSGQV